MSEQEYKRAYELQVQKAKEQNDITFMMKDIELRKWCFDATKEVQMAKVAYEFITGYEKAPEPVVQEPEQLSDIPYDNRN